MAEVVIPYKPRPQQLEWHESKKRWSLLLCHRRFGKTVCAVNETIKGALTCDLQSPRFLYVAPLYKQAKKVAWDYFKYFSRPIAGVKFNESELRVDFPNGARIQLGGGDNPDSFRGEYFDGVVLDEYGDMAPTLFSKVIRPALSDRKGWCLFIGTAKGGTIFHDLYEDVKDDPEWCVRVYKASETGIIDEDELASARKLMTLDEYEQEYECSWLASIQGAYYSDQLSEASEQGRITSVPYDSMLPVSTFWDLGMSDSTTIWFVQQHGKEIRVIDCFEESGEGLDFYVKVLANRGYVYDKHYAPHDIQVRELGTGKSRLEIAHSLGIRFEVTPNIGVMDGINAARMIFSRCWFDEVKCKHGLQALRNYRKEWSDKRREFSSKPLHDWSSHFADAFRYMAVNMKEKKEQSKLNYKRKFA